MTIRTEEAAEYIATHANASSWDIADYLVGEFPESEYPSSDGVRSGIENQLEGVSKTLRTEYGIEQKANTLKAKRLTAIRFPASTRVDAVAYKVHQTVRDEAELKKWMRSAEREGVALSTRMVGRYRADEKRAQEGPRQVDPPGVIFERRIRAAAISLYLGSYVIQREDWWNAHGMTDEKREDMALVLRTLADRIADDR